MSGKAIIALSGRYVCRPALAKPSSLSMLKDLFRHPISPCVAGFSGISARDCDVYLRLAVEMVKDEERLAGDMESIACFQALRNYLSLRMDREKMVLMKKKLEILVNLCDKVPWLAWLSINHVVAVHSR